jgi:hypothetical protein
VDLGLLLADPALAHEVGHHAVVLGQLREVAVAEEVGAAVAHVGHEQLVAPPGRRLAVVRAAEHGGGHHGGAHAVEVRVGGAGVEDAAVGLGDGVGQHVGGLLDVRGPQRLDRQPRRHLAALVPAHPVGHGVEADVLHDQERVLVDRAHAPGVGDRADDDSQAHDPSSRTVLPICSLSPRWNTIGPVTLCRLR